jgi:hypothetical protein
MFVSIRIFQFIPKASTKSTDKTFTSGMKDGQLSKIASIRDATCLKKIFGYHCSNLGLFFRMIYGPNDLLWRLCAFQSGPHLKQLNRARSGIKYARPSIHGHDFLAKQSRDINSPCFTGHLGWSMDQYRATLAWPQWPRFEISTVLHCLPDPAAPVE